MFAYVFSACRYTLDFKPDHIQNKKHISQKNFLKVFSVSERVLNISLKKLTRGLEVHQTETEHWLVATIKNLYTYKIWLLYTGS